MSSALSYQKIIYSEELILIGEKSNSAAVPIVSGQTFAFSFKIPENVPEDLYVGTLCASLDKISVMLLYSVKSVVQLVSPDVKNDYCEEFLQVLPSVLTTDANLAMPVPSVQSLPVGADSSIIELKCTNLRPAYKPNEKIDVLLALSNRTPYAIVNVRTQLNRCLYVKESSGAAAAATWAKHYECVAYNNHKVQSGIALVDFPIAASFVLRAPWPTVFGAAVAHVFELQVVVEHKAPSRFTAFSLPFLVASDAQSLPAFSGYISPKDSLKQFSRARAAIFSKEAK